MVHLGGGGKTGGPGEEPVGGTHSECVSLLPCVCKRQVLDEHQDSLARKPGEDSALCRVLSLSQD